MTYNQAKAEIEKILTSMAMIRCVKNARPQEWLNNNEAAIFPLACYFLTGGSFNAGQEQEYSITVFFLDKSGQEFLYEGDVTSDQVMVASDFVNIMRAENKPYSVDTDISFDAVSGKFEDYLSGVSISFTMETDSRFGACDVPTK
jgi:hypothetical protein